MPRPAPEMPIDFVPVQAVPDPIVIPELLSKTQFKKFDVMPAVLAKLAKTRAGEYPARPDTAAVRTA